MRPAHMQLQSRNSYALLWAKIPAEIPTTPSPRNKSILICTDSQSSLSALSTGPLNQDDEVADDCWNRLLQLTKRGYRIHLQFLYAHCGVLRNEAVDKAAALARRERGLDRTPTWWKDRIRAVNRTLYGSRRDEADLTTPRESVLGYKPTIHQSDAPRGTSKRASCFRCGETVDLGIFRRRLKIDKALPCRWCRPDVHESLRSAPDEGDPVDGEPQKSEYRPPSMRPQTCTKCGDQLSNKQALRTHYAKMHPKTPCLQSSFQIGSAAELPP